MLCCHLVSDLTMGGFNYIRVYVFCLLAFSLPLCSPFHVKQLVIPHDAQPGYVIASLPYWGQHFTINTIASRSDVTKYFTILNTGDVITSSNISSLVGEKVSLAIDSKLLKEHWRDSIHLIVRHRSSIVTFTQQRYEGTVEENSPAGSLVFGLENLVAATSVNKLIQYSLVSGALDQFEILQPSDDDNAPEIRTRKMLDRELNKKWFLEIEAVSEDPSDDPVYAKIRITVLDVNDNPPEFSKDFYHVTIKDSTSSESTLLMLSATDLDGGILRYYMEQSDLFRIEPDSGAVVLQSRKKLDPKTYVFDAWAEDEGGLRSKPVNIQVDVNGNLYYEPHAGRHHHDRRTRWRRDTRSVKNMDIMESLVGKLVDLPNNIHERFSFKEPAPDNLEIDAVTGAIHLKQGRHLDYETEPEFEFIVRITRDDNPSYEREQPVKINLLDVNDEKPEFKNLPRPFLATVSPNAGPANYVTQLIAEDPDKGSMVQYNLDSGGEDRFEVDPETGVVRTKGNQPFRPGKEYEIGVSAEDINAPTLQKSMTYSLKILVGERDPQFYETQYKASVPETAPEGFEIIQVQAKSHQAYPISFELSTESGSQSNDFAINSQTGVVDLLRRLDYEKDPAEYHLRVMAIENGRPTRTSTVSLIISLVDMNDNSPTFPLSQYIVQGIAETVQVGADIMQVTATDVDSVTNSQLTYSVSDSNFTVQTFNNIGYIRTHRRLDYDSISDHIYNFTVTATDNGSPAHSGTAMVRVGVSNVNDEDPQFMQPIEHVQVSEDATINTVIHVVQAYDPDGDRVTYSFTGKWGNHLNDGPFSIDPQAGIITMVGSLDRSRVQYRLNITATDDGSCCGSTTSRSNTGLVIVEVKDVNNNAPRFPDCGTYKPEVLEGEKVGTSVVKVEAVDPDIGNNGNVTYSLVKTNDQTNDNFFIEPNTGIIRTADVFDREKQIGVTDYGITVKAEDQGSSKLAGFCTFRVKIGDQNDNPPVFNLPVYSTSIEENSVIGKKVKQVYAMDRDAGQNGEVEYFIRSDPSGFFTINQYSGWVSVARPMTGLDHVQLEIEARDRGTPTKSSTVNMDIGITQTMNAYPQWVEDYSAQPIVISENVPVNHIIARIKATSSMPNSQVNYFIQHGESPEQNGPPRSFYHRMEEDTNEMILMTYRPLDYEAIPQYTLTIKAANRASNSLHNDTRLIIHLRDENDEIPQFIGMDENGRYPGSVAENLEPGAEVIGVTASDRDEFERFRKIHYRIKELGQDYKSFTIDRQTGLIRTTSTFDRERESEYYITVVAEDGAKSDRPNHYPPGTPNQGEAEVQIRITDKNDNSPYFKKEVYHAQVAENADAGALVLHVIAEDQDEVCIEGNSLSYSISGGNVGNAFQVHPTQGEIKVRGPLDYDQGIRKYELTYRVFDDKYANTTKVIISVIDVNDNPPKFDHAIYNVTDINEEEPGISRNNPTYLLTVRATDPDSERDSNLKYSLTGQFADDGTFMINEYTGEIYLTRKLDRDKPRGRPVWNFNVLAHDEVGSGTSLTGYAEVRVMPRDINDNAPRFDRSRLKGSIPENSDEGDRILTVIADDVDNGSNGTVTYSLRQVPMHGSTPLFSIDSHSGLITTTESDTLDRESQEEYKVIVVAKDRGPNPQSSTAVVTIVVTDINDHKPEFTQDVYHAIMSENYAIGASITSVSATDLDIGSNAALRYFLKESDRGFFKIDTIKATNTGVLKVFKAVDYDTLLRPLFNITVYVTDPIQDDSHTDTAYIEVRVTDYNDNPPVFQPPTHQVRVFENVKVGTILARFKATDRDTGDNKLFHYAVDRTTDPHRQFSINSNGLVTTTKMLDRETEPTHRVHILAIDHGTPEQTGVGTLIVNLMDINDNFPTFAEDYRPVIYENEKPGKTVVVISAIDKDTATNGPPFEMWLPCKGSCPCRENPVCGLFDFKFEPDRIRWTGKGEQAFGIGTIRSLKTFDREEQKEYYMPIVMQDSGDPAMSGTNTLTIIIGDKNDNVHHPGHKDIFIYNYKGMFEDAALGNVYAEDEDDWDVVNKTFFFVSDETKQHFRLDEESGMLYMNGRLREGKYTFQVKVYDVVHRREVVSSATVSVKNIGDDAVLNSGSIRLSGVTAEEFASRKKIPEKGTYQKSRYDILREQIALKLGIPTNNVDIFTVRNHPTLPKTIDIRYSAHGSPYYRPVKLDGIISDSTEEFERLLGVRIVMTPIDECLKEECESGGCANILNVTGEPLLINTNGTSMIGVTSFVQAECVCAARTFDSDADIVCRPDSCKNGGRCHQRKYDFYCTCPPQFDGPRCQMTRHSFPGDSWAWYKPLAQCEDSHTSLEFITTRENGIILYNGPIRDLVRDQDQDFILLELRSGFPYLQIDHGTGVAKLTVDGRDTKNKRILSKLNDGKWHRIDIYRNARIVRMVVDSCASAVINENENVLTSSEDRRPCEAISETPGDNKYININTPLQLGGMADMTNGFIKKILPSGAKGFEGCLKNLIHNGELYDLYIGNVGQHMNSEDGCPIEDVVCGVNDITGLKCGINGTCVGSLLKEEYRCECKPGWRGPRCSIPTTTKDFRQRSFIEWDFKDRFYAELDRQLHRTKLQLMFRTRQESGLLFKAQNVQKSEYLRLELLNQRIRFRFNLGSGEQQVSLHHVNISDGQWHTVRVERTGQWVMLSLDSGEGRFFNETFGSSVDHRHIRVSQRSMFAGGDVRFPSSNSPPLVDFDYEDSCMNDIRYNDEWFPMDHSQNAESQAADLTRSDKLQEGCPSDACLVGINCLAPLVCNDLWRHAECACPVGQEYVGHPDICLNINECVSNPCLYGMCVDHDFGFSCTCEPGYGGELCASPQQANNAYLNTGFILAIVICALVLLLIILIFIVYTRRRRPDSYTVGVDPDDDVRENIIHYDEEGVGEEDQDAYDINRLKKPMDDNLKCLPPPETILPPLKEKPRKRIPYKPGETPDVGNFINDRLDDADNDPNAPPHDSVREYAYEGAGSDGGSLSSLASTSDAADQNYDYLNDWGQRFSKLADLYGPQGS